MLSPTETVCVVGLGYIGLPTASLLANRGFQVLGVDVVPSVIETINRGEIHICEPELDAMVRAAVGSGKLKAALKPSPADVFILAVPTPFKDGHKPDMRYVEAAAASIVPHLRPGNLVILESTSPVGSTESVAQIIATGRPDLVMPVHGGKGPGAAGQLFVAHCPERVLPGQIMRELVENDRVIGGIDEASTKHCHDLYLKFVSGALLTTDARTAEMCKLTENSFRDVNIAFANELSLICDRLNMDVWELIRLANHHPRVKILQPGPGVGGHCIAVDPWFIVDSAPDLARVIRTAREVNDSKPEWVISRIATLADRFKAPRIALLGMAFKPDVDDLRESPAVEIAHRLAERKVGELLVVEPHVEALPKALAGMAGVSLAGTEAAIAAADIVVMLVNHRQFQSIDRRSLVNKQIIDTRGVWR
jgi:UDP-N-acetyl-D-mannosaminuronic acid dehydrogenase